MLLILDGTQKLKVSDGTSACSQTPTFKLGWRIVLLISKTMHEKTLRRRQALRSHLQKIVDASSAIGSLLRDEPYPRGLQRYSLAHKKGESIIHAKNGGFKAFYRAADSTKYEVDITPFPVQESFPLDESYHEPRTRDSTNAGRRA